MKKYVVGGAVILAGLVGVECVCRWGLGLGSPPLSVAHPTIEYMFKPNTTYKRFGRVVKFNRYGMRSDAIAPRRAAHELRILVLGDSVPNGGSLTDQAELATEIVKRDLTARLSRPVVVGNISAGTWSPPNLLAYIEVFGTFDATVAVIILNGEDLDDVPTFAPLNPRTHPTRKPLTATGELVSRYLWPRLAGLLDQTDSEELPPPVVGARAQCVAALDALVDRLRADGCQVVMMYHPFRHEMSTDGTFVPDEAFGVIRSIAAQHGVSFRSLDGRYSLALRHGSALYRDGQHPTAEVRQRDRP
ncbi:MAG: hypothetical protein HQ523_13810 [Lentisphaerae bacterium]|nr:hypothetical protein [Lentisphaerota bacterium]